MVELLIEGQLPAVTQNWYAPESLQRRRRVPFTSYRTNEAVTIVILEPQSANYSPCISCLQSRDGQRHFFVGTDALVALEVMLGVSLTDEQKKSLRNKFERHGSTTIRKDIDDDGLFELIEGNNDIRPRNLHKGVRVYPWERLSAFLKDLASKVPPSLVPPTLLSSPSSVPVAQFEQSQASYMAPAATVQFDQYGTPLTPTGPQMPFMQSSPGGYSADPYGMYTSSQPSYMTPVGYSSPTYAPQYTMPSPQVMMNVATAQPGYNVTYAQHQPIQTAHWEHHGIRYSG